MECCICFNEFSSDPQLEHAPIQGSCGHNVCKACIQQLAAPANHLKCPTCQKTSFQKDELISNVDLCEALRRLEYVAAATRGTLAVSTSTRENTQSTQQGPDMNANLKSEPQQQDDAIPTRNYGDEVVGHRVEILFVNPHDEPEFYPGTIQKMGQDGQHFVHFDDGDQRWIDLGEQEEEGNVQWLDEKKRPAPSSAITPEKKQRKTSPKQEEMREDTTEAVDTKSAVEKDVWSEEESSDIASSVDTNGKLAQWVDEHGMPESITKIVHLMDELEPGINYYRHQQDSRGECSGLRGKLRKHARSNTNDPATRHWLQTKNWEPPNVETLQLLIELIKTKIDLS